MGIRFSTNTWRAPLQLINCWLPVKQTHTYAPPLTLPRTLQKFVRAGWLNRATSPSYPGKIVPNTARLCTNVHSLDAHRRLFAQPPLTRHHTDTRLVLSGRMRDVCAELDRLAAIEMRTVQ